PQYLGLEQLCQEFAVELLGMCRNQSEVTTILNSCGDESQDALDEQAFEEGIPNLSRLRLAVNYNQKQVGFFWYECKEVWIEGLRSYFLDWWNCLDMIVLSMYLASFALRVLIMLKGHFLCHDQSGSDECIYFTQTVRDSWHQEDPQLISEVLFAVTSMLSFTRLAYILPAHESLGTLQISIGKMIDDMMRFNETFNFLFWTMFGMASQDYVDLPQFVLAEFVGRILYGIFTLIIDDADVEWKFARSKLYLSYFREGLTMPVPFNIIPSPKAGFYLLSDKGSEEGLPYRQQVIRALVQRYIESARREFEETKRKDIGNRITELNKAVSRMHIEMKGIQQLLMTDGHAANDTPTQGGYSMLGKYFIGAKNNFRGFNSRQDDKNTSLNVTLHHKEEGADERKADSEVQQDADADQVDESEEELNKVTDCEVVKMEEGRANAELGNGKETEESEHVEISKDDKVREKVTQGTSFISTEEMVNVESTQGKEDKREGEINPQVTEELTEIRPEHPESTDTNSETTDAKKMINKFNNMELKERTEEAGWMKGKKSERNGVERSHVTKGDEKNGNKKVIQSPTGSSGSNDTGFGSQEGEGSIDGVPVKP
ncbi:hypothetical protein GOODEAATRI_023329, partial [Goodea atripinnis]